MLGLAIAVSCDGRKPAPLSPDFVAAKLVPPQGEGRVTRVRSRADVPLGGLRVDAEPGDFMLEHDGLVAVVSAELGAVVDFGPKGTEDALSRISPSIFDGMSGARTPVVLIAEPIPGVLRVDHRASALPARLITFFTFRGRALVLDSAVVPEDGHATGMAIGVGERVSWGNLPTWIEGTGFAPGDGGSFLARFLGRDGPGLYYAVGLDDGERMSARVGSIGFPGYYPQARSWEVVATDGAGTMRRTLLVGVSQTSLGAAAASIGIPGREVAMPGGLSADARVEIAACEADGEPRKPFARFGASDRSALVPDGCHEARIVAEGHAPTEWMKPEALASAKVPPAGTIAVRITEGDAPLPSRVQLRGLGTTPDPNWGEDPDDGAALNAVHTEKGEVRRAVPPGKYRLLVDRGFEYTIHDETVDIRAGEETRIDAKLERVVDTKGWLAADLHLHAAPSPDAPQSLAERVRALAASGVEVGVATDHNKVTDYRPEIERLGLSRHVASIVGDEVTTEDMGFGHFNVFPLAVGSAPLRYKGVTPDAIFQEARRRAPRLGGTIIQVNHPRMGDIGYFDVVRFHREDVAAFEKRRPGWLGFDAIEVYNAEDTVELKNVEACMRDWFALLDAGYRITATGNSDSHKLSFHEPGLPRTYVAAGSDDPGQFDEAAFLGAVDSGRVIVSGGPFLRLDVAGKGPGERVAPGLVEISVVVDAPPWMDIAVVELVVKGKLVATETAPFEVGPHRAELRAEVPLAAGDWVIAVTRGRKEMAPFYVRGIYPFAFTNPVMVE